MKLLTSAILLTFAATSFAQYEAYFPEYFEYCTATQVKYQKEYFDGATGGPGGHGFMYIQGLCKDYSKDYPQVVPCDEKSNHEGVGISLDSDYTNLAWVAVPGRDLMMNGNVERGNVTKQDVEGLLQQALDLRIFENVKMKPESVNKHTFNTPEYEKAAALFSIGTDIAVNWGRELRCVRIPVNKAAIAKAAEYLNGMNNKYYLENKAYEWSMVKNNCTHLAVNTSNAMGINSSLETDKGLATQIFNLAVPANAYLMYVDKAVLKNTNERKIKRSKVFKELGFSPNQVGTMMVHMPVYPSNVMFNNSDLKAVTLPRKNLLKLTATPVGYEKHASRENTELIENAKKWKTIYDQMELQNNEPFDSYLTQQKELVEKILRETEEFD